MKKLISWMLVALMCCGLVIQTMAAPAFSDVPGDAYFKNAVDWAVSHNVTAGVGNGQFGPNQGCTRAQAMTFLWRAHGSPEPKNLASGTGFADVHANDYFAKPVAWAVENGITSGVGGNKFGAHQTCTRGQIMTFIWRAENSANDYFAKPVAWAVENGITSGVGGNKFGAHQTCTRGQIMTFIWRAENSPMESANTLFSDVHSNDYYNHAIAWAVNHGVTAGVGANKFGPNQSCTRAQIVTFLWRADSIIDSKPEKPVEPTEPVTPPTVPTEPSKPVEPERPTEPVDPPQHEHNYEVGSIVDANCTREGYTLYICWECGDQYHADIVPALGHRHTETYEQAATCGKSGYKRVYCDDCRKTISEDIYPATQKHNYQWHTASEAASVAMDHWSGAHYGAFLGYDDWDVKMCENCYHLDLDTLKSKYTDDEAARVMLEQYVNPLRKEVYGTDEYAVKMCENCYHLDLDTLKSKYTDDEAARVMLEQYVNPLRKEVYGTDEYAMTIDSTLMELAKIRAIEIVTDYNHNAWFNAGENIAQASYTVKSNFEGWLSSSGHKANMLNQEYKYFGYARHFTPGNGVTKADNVFSVQLFWSQYGKDNYIPRN